LVSVGAFCGGEEGFLILGVGSFPYGGFAVEGVVREGGADEEEEAEGHAVVWVDLCSKGRARGRGGVVSRYMRVLIELEAEGQGQRRREMRVGRLREGRRKAVDGNYA
jgi:hypothetical protein